MFWTFWVTCLSLFVADTCVSLPRHHIPLATLTLNMLLSRVPFCLLVALALVCILGVQPIASKSSRGSSGGKLVVAPKLTTTGAIELRADNIDKQVLENGVWFVRLYVPSLLLRH
jgi:hypothetical protein